MKSSIKRLDRPPYTIQKPTKAAKPNHAATFKLNYHDPWVYFSTLFYYWVLLFKQLSKAESGFSPEEVLRGFPRPPTTTIRSKFIISRTPRSVPCFRTGGFLLHKNRSQEAAGTELLGVLALRLKDLWPLILSERRLACYKSFIRMGDKPIQPTKIQWFIGLLTRYRFISPFICSYIDWTQSPQPMCRPCFLGLCSVPHRGWHPWKKPQFICKSETQDTPCVR